jgi:hypothetical protein
MSNEITDWSAASWFGTRDLTHCLKLAREGWPEGTKRLVQMQGELANINAGGGSMPAPRFAESGDEVDIDRFIGGDPENMIEFPLRDYNGGKGGKVVKLLVNITVGVYVPNNSIFLRGAVALKFIDILEDYGYRVEVWIGEVGVSAGKNIFIRSLIKPANQHFDLDRMAFAMCNPSVQRRLFFRIYEQLPKHVWDMETRNYGGVGNFDDPDPEIIEIGGLNNHLSDPKKAEAYIFAALTKFGMQLGTTNG